MSRYFIEVCYKGTVYAGFQVQHNALTIQEEVEKALAVFFRNEVKLTGSSRTDAGVHALQNCFHFDLEGEVDDMWIYNINSLLPDDIAVVAIRKVRSGAHCRFDALSRQYSYMVYGKKDPFIRDRAYYFPYVVDMGAMRCAAGVLKEYSEFGSFAKRNSQVKTFSCRIMDSEWHEADGYKVYRVKANRFLRGMVKGMVGTMLQVGRKKISVDEFREIIESGDSSRVDFSVPSHGLCLEKVEYAEGYFDL
jgi:tRNA pseudouridine38-40 synthase